MGALGCSYRWCHQSEVEGGGTIYANSGPRSGNEIGPFKAIEESIIAHLTEPQSRGDIYAWYGLLGFAGSAVGMAGCGWVVHHLTQARQWDVISSYRAIYLGYAAMGVLKLILSLFLSRSVELERKGRRATENTGNAEETTPLLRGRTEAAPKRGLRSLLPDISKHSVAVVINLCLLFAVDSFASGLTAM